MAYNKLVVDGIVKFDCNSATVEADKLAKGVKAIDKHGDLIVGTSTKDSDTSDGTVNPSDIPKNEIAYSQGNRIVGTAPKNEGYVATISSVNDKKMIPVGYHDGSGYVEIDADEKKKVKAEVIVEGNTILGVDGTAKIGTQEVKQQKTVTPTMTQQVIVADSGYTCLSQVTVNAIPYAETPNANGTTITIG